MTQIGEFDFIGRYFRPLAGKGALDLRDDAALIAARPGYQMVVSTDTIVENVHFLSDDPADTVGRKLLRVNLSDCAAMGGTPFGYVLNVSRPAERHDEWFETFAAGLAADQREYGVVLLGGDTTSIRGPLVLTATIFGWLPNDKGLYRRNARIGDDVWVSGTIGDAALGLRALRGEIPDFDGHFSNRYRLPQPRLGMALNEIVHAAMDISDGLLQDCGHLARESNVDLVIEAERVPLSPQARALGNSVMQLCLTGGDDYELLLTCAPDRACALWDEAKRAGVALTRVGCVMSGTGKVRLHDAKGESLDFPSGGWVHF